jgi:hypothetical protein
LLSVDWNIKRRRQLEKFMLGIAGVSGQLPFRGDILATRIPKECAMSVVNLSKRTIESVAATEEAVILYDNELTGFGIRIARTGVRSWFIEYRPQAGRNKRRMVFGKSPTLTPEEARKEARRLLASVALGGDPVGQRSHQRSIPTFSEISDAYLDEAAETSRSRPLEARLRPRTIGNYRSLLKQHIAPHIGRLRLDMIMKADVMRLHSSMGKSKPATANRCLEFIGSIFRHASRLGIVEEGANPARGMIERNGSSRPALYGAKCSLSLSEVSSRSV